MSSKFENQLRELWNDKGGRIVILVLAFAFLIFVCAFCGAFLLPGSC